MPKRLRGVCTPIPIPCSSSLELLPPFGEVARRSTIHRALQWRREPSSQNWLSSQSTCQAQPIEVYGAEDKFFSIIMKSSNVYMTWQQTKMCDKKMPSHGALSKAGKVRAMPPDIESRKRNSSIPRVTKRRLYHTRVVLGRDSGQYTPGRRRRRRRRR